MPNESSDTSHSERTPREAQQKDLIPHGVVVCDEPVSLADIFG